MTIGSLAHAASRRWVFVALLLIAGSGAAFLIVRFAVSRTTPVEVEIPPLPETAFDPHLHKIRFAPVLTPDALAAEDPRLSSDTPVIGVTVGGASRAYVIRAFTPVDLHVVNDLVGGRPVTVTHCPRTGCTRVYTDPNRRVRLLVAVGGFYGDVGDESLLLRVGVNRYHQETGAAVRSGTPLSYQVVRHERTTWGEWRRHHPDSDCYLGPEAAP